MLDQAIRSGLVYGEQNLAFLAHAEGRDADAIEYFARGSLSFLSGFPADANRILAEGLFGGATAHAEALAMVNAYLASQPKTLSGAAPFALLLLGEPAQALAVAQERITNNDSLIFNWLWSPHGAAARRLPQFPLFAQKVGWVALWDQFGAPDGFHRRAAGDYACDGGGDPTQGQDAAPVDAPA
jgi:hypothetical protein